MPIIVPAILTDDLGDYKNKITVANSITDWIHIDISDGQFVPRQTISLQEIVAIHRLPAAEVHLMVNRPEQYFDDCLTVKAQTVLCHFESIGDHQRMINQARHKGLKVGLVFNPESSIDRVVQFDARVSVIQLMGVQPGYYGRPFIAETLDRLRALRPKIKHAMLAADGGVNLTNIAEVAATGVDRIVVGSGIFGADDPALAYGQLQQLIS